MTDRRNIFAIVGSASTNSANQKLVERIAQTTADDFNWTVYNDLKNLPPFDPELSIDNPPQQVIEFREAVSNADGILICTPEYVFSIPSGLKNAIEWCVSTTVFSNKPSGLITASTDGQKGHEELALIMRTVMAKFTDETTLLIQGIKGKFDLNGKLVHDETINKLNHFITAFRKILLNGDSSTKH